MADETNPKPIWVGTLSCGMRVEAVLSKESAFPDSFLGTHYIFHFVGDPPRGKVPTAAVLEFDETVRDVAQKLSDMHTSGDWRIEVNGPKRATQDHYHVHILCPNRAGIAARGLKMRRSVDSVV